MRLEIEHAPTRKDTLSRARSSAVFAELRTRGVDDARSCWYHRRWPPFTHSCRPLEASPADVPRAGFALFCFLARWSRSAKRIEAAPISSGRTAMQHKRPTPLADAPQKPRRVCPVCGAAAYSRSGIHPQCAAQRADAMRMARVKASRKAAQTAPAQSNSLVLAPWHKRCPKCSAQVHIRKAACDCGYRFG